MSLNQYYYAKTLVNRGLIKPVSITDTLKVFEIMNTKGEEYEVMVNDKGYSCTCVFGSLWSGGDKDCCHIKAVKMVEGEYER